MTKVERYRRAFDRRVGRHRLLAILRRMTRRDIQSLRGYFW